MRFSRFLPLAMAGAMVRIMVQTVIWILVLTVVWVTAPPLLGADEDRAIVPRLRELISGSGAEVVGLAVEDTGTGRQILIDERVSLHAASTMKLPVMIEIFRRADRREMRLDQPVRIDDRFASIVDGSEYRLTSDSDSDQLVYRRLGGSMTVIELVERMIVRSSNLATNLLIAKVGADKVTATARKLGADAIQVRRGVEDTRAFQAGLNNTTTALDLMVLLRAVAANRAASRKSCDQMISILAAQEFNSGIPAGLPPGTRVAHKTGEITRHNHDAAIVFPPGRKPYIIVILTRGIAEREKSDRLIASLAREVHRELTGAASTPQSTPQSK